MKSPLFSILALSLMALSSCSSIKKTMGKVTDSTANTFRAAKEKTLGPSKPKLRLTKADPKRFLPAGTSAEALKKHAEPQSKPRMMLAKNTKPTNPSHHTKAPSKKQAEPEEFPTIELPPLPEATAADKGEYRGILPSLDDSDTATFIDIDGETPELPPMEIPELEEECEEIDPDKSA